MKSHLFKPVQFHLTGLVILLGVMAVFSASVIHRSVRVSGNKAAVTRGAGGATAFERTLGPAPQAAPTPPTPVVDIAVPDFEFPDEEFIGEGFCYIARLTNQGEPGFGPYLRVITSKDVTLDPLKTGFISGLSVKVTEVAAVNGMFTDPYTGTGFSAKPGDHFYLVEPPIGSLVQGEPPIDIRLFLNIPVTAALNVPITVCHTPVYRFGAVPLGGAPITGTQVCEQVTPVVLKFRKVAIAAKNDPPAPALVEAVPGSCSLITFELHADIANAQTVTGLVFKDNLPSTLQFVPGSIMVTGVTPPDSFSIVSQPSGTMPGGLLEVNVTGDVGLPGPETCDRRVVGPGDVIVSFKAYIVPGFLDSMSCQAQPVAARVVVNQATLDASYNNAALPQLTSQVGVEAKHVAVQKVADRLEAKPDEVINYTIAFQVAQNISASGLLITDRLGDGLSFVPGSTTLTTTSSGSSPITPGVSTSPVTGVTTLTFNVAAALPTLAGCTSGVITYQAKVSQNYTATSAPVLASDRLFNNVTADYNIVSGASGCSDQSLNRVDIVPVTITKSLVNPQPEYKPGDTVTFRLKMTIPSGDTKTITFEDFLPLPVFDASSITAGDIRLGPGHTFGGLPGFTSSPATNSIKFTFSDITTPTPTTLQCLEVEFDVKVTSIPFADDLSLTNLFQSRSQNTEGEEQVNLTGLLIHVRAPALRIVKGVSASDNPNATINPPPSTLPVNGNIGGTDAADVITFTLTITNTGGATAYDVVVTDVIPGGLNYVPGSLAHISGPAPVLNDSGAPTLTASYSSFPNGQTSVITFQARVDTSVTQCQVITNTGRIVWASRPSAALFPQQQDSATVSMTAPIISKTILGTSQAHTSGTNVVIGETVQYRIQIRVPEGAFTGVKITDSLAPGLAIVDTSVIATATVLTSVGGLTGVISSQGQLLTFNLGPVANPNTNNAVNEYITFDYTAVVLNTLGNVQGAQVRNNVTWMSNQCVMVTGSAPPLTVIEPKLQVVKEVVSVNSVPVPSPTPVPNVKADAGDVIEYRITITNSSPSATDAFDVTLSDAIHTASSTYAAGSFMHTGGLAPTSMSSTFPVNATWTQFPLGATSTFKLRVTMNNTVVPCQNTSNSALPRWTSLPGSPGQISPHNPNAFERTGSGQGVGPFPPPVPPPGELNNYFAVGSVQVFVPNATMVKSILSTSDPNTIGANLTIGEEVTYQLTITLPEGRTPPTTVVTDVLPPGMQAISAMLVPGSPGAPLVPNPTITQPGGCSGGNVVFTFNQPMLVAGDNNPANNSFDLRVTARVCDVPGNVGCPGAPTLLSNSATLQVGNFNCQLVPSNTVTTTVVEPCLAMTKAFSPTLAPTGGTDVQITLTMRNNGTSTAWDVIVDDLLPSAKFSGMMAVSTPAGFTFSLVSTPPNTIVRYSGGSIPPGGSAIFTFKATPAAGCETFTNIATITQATTLPGASAFERDEPDVSGSAILDIRSACPCVNPPANMVAWWPFDEASGPQALDISGHNNDGQLSPDFPNGNAPLRVPGALVNGSLDFDGVDDFVNVPDDASLDVGTGSLTIDAWIRPDNVSGIRPIVEKRENTAPQPTGYTMFLFNGNLSLQLANGATIFNYISTTAIPTGIWSHVAVVADRVNGVIRMYLNGTPVFATTSNIVGGNISNPSPLFIGRHMNLSAFFDGMIDEVELFNRALSGDEVQSVARAGESGKCKLTSTCPPDVCCGAKPPIATAQGFTGAVAVATCYYDARNAQFSPNDPGYVLGIVDISGRYSQTLNVNWAAPMYHGPSNIATNPNSWTKNNLGNIFGVTLDAQGNIYVTATSAYTSEFDSPPFADVFGPGGAGAIYRIDGATGFITTFAVIPNNTGPALGNITYDCLHRQFFVTNMEDGLLYRIAGAGHISGTPGTILGTAFDHGVAGRPVEGLSVLADTNTAGFTPRGRRLWGVQIHNNRVYYAVWNEDCNAGNANQTAVENEIWSVGLDAAGDFKVNSARRENLTIPPIATVSGPYSNPVSDISFSAEGNMLLAERSMSTDSNSNSGGAAHASRVLEYICNNSDWTPSPATFRIGSYDPGLVRGCAAIPNSERPANAAGGVDYDPYGNVWATGDALNFGESPGFQFIYGLQSLPGSGGDKTNSVLIDLNGVFTPLDKTEIGDVETPCLPCQTPPTAGMVAWWSFDELSGSTAADISPQQQNQGSLRPDAVSGPQHVNGLVSLTLDFDGVNDYVEVQDHSSLDFGTGNLTIDAWIRPDDITGVRPIVDKRENTAPQPTGYTMFLANGNLSFQLANGTTFFNYISTAVIPAGVWTHVAVVADRTGVGEIRMYVNGVLVFNPTTSIVVGNLSNQNPLWIGQRHPVSGAMSARFFDGQIDEVELFNRALTEGEVRSIFQVGRSGKCKSCPDSTGNLNTGFNQAANTLIAVGGTEDDWRVIADPNPATVEPRLANVVDVYPGWSAALANSLGEPSRWISVSAGRGSGFPTGDTTYEYTFCLTPGFTNAQMELSLRADNQITSVLLNGNQIMTTGGIFSGVPMNINVNNQAFFLAGNNSLRVVVNDVGVVTGLNVAGRVTTQ